MKDNKFLVLLVPFLSFLLLEIYFFYPRSVFIVLVFLFLAVFFLARQFKLASGKKDSIVSVISLPLIFIFGSIFVSFFIPSGYKWLIHLLFLIDIVFSYYYFRLLYYYFLRPDLYQKVNMEILSTYGAFVAFYFTAVSFFGFQLFLDVAIWKLVLFLDFAVFLIVFQAAWAGAVDKKTTVFYALLLNLIMLELAWAISFLTLSYYILGLLLAISFYVLIGLVRFYLFGNLNKEKVKLYLLFGLVSIFIALLTAQWI
jgi:hypothetical protein